MGDHIARFQTAFRSDTQYHTLPQIAIYFVSNYQKILICEDTVFSLLLAEENKKGQCLFAKKTLA